MARAIFGDFSPHIVKATQGPTPYNPLGALSTAIEQPFVTDVIVPGISRIRDELRISEQEDLIAEQAAAKRAAAAQAMQRAAAAEQQGLEAEIAYGVGGVDVPLMDAAAMEQLSAAGRQPVGAAPGATAVTAVREAMGLGPADPRSVTTARQLQQARDALLRGDVDAERAVGLIVSRMKRMGMQDVAFDILSGGMGAEDALAAASGQLQQTQQRRGEQEATVEATQRFERALAGDLPQMAAAEQAVAEQALTPMMVNGRPGVRTRGYEGDKEQGRIDAIATRAYRKADRAGKSREESVAIGLAAAQAAQPEAVAAQEAQEAQAIQRPGLIEEANRLREQATAMEREAKGIEATPVYRTFGDHAMAFLDALDSGDVAKQNALMASVGGSTDYQPFGKGAVGKAMGKDASMRARKDLLDLKKKYLEAQRREKTGLKFIEARKRKPKRTGKGGGGGTTRNQDRVLDSALQTLHRGEALSPKQKRALRKGGLLTEREVAALTPDRPDAWAVLRSRMSKRSPLRNDAATILRSRATPEERERAAEREEDAQIKRLEAEARTATTATERMAKANAAKRLRLGRDIRGARGRLDRANEDSRRFGRGIVNNTAEAAQATAAANAITGTDSTSVARKATLNTQATNASRRARQGEAEKVHADAKVTRVDAELSGYEDRLSRLPAQAD